MKRTYAALVFGLFLTLGIFPNAGGNDKKAPGKEIESTVALVGPVPLGELFRNMSHKDEVAKRLTVGGWPAESQVIESLNKIKLWIKDSKSLDSGKWKLDFIEHPAILLEGPASFDLKSKKGTEFVLSIREVDVLDTGYSNDGKSRRIRVFLSLRTSPYPIQLGGGGTLMSTANSLNVFSNPISWDLTGKVSWAGKTP